MKIKNITQTFFSLALMLSMLSAVIPLHNIVHQHYFIKADTCGNSCEKHLKNYSKPCCTTSDAIFISDLPVQQFQLQVHQPVIKLISFNSSGNYFQFFHLTRNKAPPVAA